MSGLWAGQGTGEEVDFVERAGGGWYDGRNLVSYLPAAITI